MKWMWRASAEKTKLMPLFDNEKRGGSRIGEEWRGKKEGAVLVRSRSL